MGRCSMPDSWERQIIIFIITIFFFFLRTAKTGQAKYFLTLVRCRIASEKRNHFMNLFFNNLLWHSTHRSPFESSVLYIISIPWEPWSFCGFKTWTRTNKCVLRCVRHPRHELCGTGTWSKRRLPNVPLMLQLFVFVSLERLNSLNIKIRAAG